MLFTALTRKLYSEAGLNSSSAQDSSALHEWRESATDDITQQASAYSTALPVIDLLVLCAAARRHLQRVLEVAITTTPRTGQMRTW